MSKKQNCTSAPPGIAEIRRALRHLLTAVNQSVAAAKDAETARDELIRLVERYGGNRD